MPQAAVNHNSKIPVSVILSHGIEKAFLVFRKGRDCLAMIRSVFSYLPRKMLNQLCGTYMPFMPEVLTNSQAVISAQMTAPVQIVRVFW